MVERNIASLLPIKIPYFCHPCMHSLRRQGILITSVDQNLGERYEYVLEIADRPSRLGFPEGTLTSVCVYEQETIKLNTDHYFIEQYHRQRAPLKHLCRCVLLDQSIGILTRTWGGSAIGGDIVLELTSILLQHP